MAIPIGLKKVQLQLQNGNYSSPIGIILDANHIYLENAQNLQNVIGNYNSQTDGGTIKAILDQIKQNIQNLNINKAGKNEIGKPPKIAKTASDMSDTNSIYVYQGEETNILKKDNWYSYLNGQWVSGGPYISNFITIDSSLTESGAAAEAEVTGQRLDSLQYAIDTKDFDISKKIKIQQNDSGEIYLVDTKDSTKKSNSLQIIDNSFQSTKMAAEAKATGDAIASLSDSTSKFISNLNTSISNLNKSISDLDTSTSESISNLQSATLGNNTSSLKTMLSNLKDNTLGNAYDSKNGDLQFQITSLKTLLENLIDFFKEEIAVDGYNSQNNRSSGANGPYIITNSHFNSSKNVYKIKLNVVDVGNGKLTVGTIKRNKAIAGNTCANYLNDVMVKEVLTISHTGVQEITFKNNFTVSDDEYIFISLPTTDTCHFKFGAYGKDTGFLARSTSDNKWTSSNSSLGVTIYIKNFDRDINLTDIISQTPKNLLKGKKLSILGDSISTYSGYIASGYGAFYPRNDVDSVNKTWWGKLMDLTGMELLVNASWSGTRVTGDAVEKTNGEVGWSDARVNALKSGNTNPDIIICYIGINDWGGSGPATVGTFDSKVEIDLTPRKITNISEAYALMLYKIRSTYPNAAVYCITQLEGRAASSTQDSSYPIKNENGETIHEVNHAIIEIAHIFGVRVIDLQTCGINFWNVANYTIDNLHPNEAGMAIIANTIYKQLLNDFK